MISVIINSNRPVQFAAVTEMYHRVMGGYPHEIIGIHDSKSAAEGYMRGFASARGDLLVFSHDDVEFLCPDLGRRIEGHLGRSDIVGIAGTTRLTHPMWSGSGPPYIFGQVAHGDPDGIFRVEIFGVPWPVVDGIQSMDGMFLAATRKAIEVNPFDPINYTGRHLYDADFCIRAFYGGLRLAVGCDLPMIHFSRGVIDQAWDIEAQRFSRQHGDKLPPYLRRPFSVAQIEVRSREDVLEIMTPPHWRNAAGNSVRASST